MQQSWAQQVLGELDESPVETITVRQDVMLLIVVGVQFVVVEQQW